MLRLRVGVCVAHMQVLETLPHYRSHFSDSGVTLSDIVALFARAPQEGAEEEGAGARGGGVGATGSVSVSAFFFFYMRILCGIWWRQLFLSEGLPPLLGVFLLPLFWGGEGGVCHRRCVSVPSASGLLE